MMADEFEIWFDKGVTDELLGSMPPNYGRLTVEKAAINAVLAGCRPEYLPVIIAAAECACDPAFNLHGVSTSTHFSAPLIVVNGPIRGRIGLNSTFGVFGPGYRANATIGRALRLLMINIGGVRPGEISMSTFGHPGRYTYCIAENEEASLACLSRGPWVPARRVDSHAVRRRRAPRDLGSFQPHRAGARRVTGLVDGGPLEQQALS